MRDSYHDMANCSWLIQVPDNYTIKIRYVEATRGLIT